MATPATDRGLADPELIGAGSMPLNRLIIQEGGWGGEGEGEPVVSGNHQLFTLFNHRGEMNDRTDR